MKKVTMLCLVAGIFGMQQNIVAQTSTTNCNNPGFTIPAKEINCFRFFEPNQAGGVKNVNNFFLAKISQLMYTERLDFELRELSNPSGFPTASFRSSQLNDGSNATFECDFSKRFSHWFYDINAKPIRPATLQNLQLVQNPQVGNQAIQVNNAITGGNKTTTTSTGMSAMEKYKLDSTNFEKSKPKFKFLNKTQDFINIGNEIRIPGFDPEVMVISTEEYIIIAWRGTDNVYKDDSWEWIGTDFYFVPTNGDGPLANAKMHAGIWNSFKIIRNKLIATLNSFDAKTKNKRIFVTGHSLGGGMALVSAPYLAGMGYKIGEVYTYASPRTVGDQAFVNKCNSLLGSDKIQRFEYGVDFVTKLWSPAIYTSIFKIPGHRHWYNASGADDDYDCGERVFPMTLNPFEYNDYPKAKIDKLNGDLGIVNPVAIAAYLKNAVDNPTIDRPKDLRGFALLDCGHHNPTYYVKKAYENMSAAQKENVPAFQDTFPYVYPAVPGNK